MALSGPARVLRVGSGKPAETWFEESGEAMVTALCPDGKGGVFFAVSPGGRIFHAQGAGRTGTPRFTAEGRYVWALALAGDRLWVGTGEPGALLSGRPEGKGELTTVLATGEDPVRALAPVAGGGIVVGTGRRGRVLRVDPGGTPFALLDADEDEIVDLAVGTEGTLWALAARERGRTRTARPASEETPRPAGDAAEPLPAPPAEPEPGEPAPAPAPAPEETRPQGPPRAPRLGGAPSSIAAGALYRIGSDGAVTRFWESPTEVPYALAVSAGTPIVGTGEVGRLQRIDRDGAAAALQRFPSDQVTALAVTASGRLLAGGSNDARVAALGPEIASAGTWTSDVLTPAPPPTGVPPAGTARLLGRRRPLARVGNTAEPDETWSPWRAVRAGEAAALPSPASCRPRSSSRVAAAPRPRRCGARGRLPRAQPLAAHPAPRRGDAGAGHRQPAGFFQQCRGAAGGRRSRGAAGCAPERPPPPRGRAAGCTRRGRARVTWDASDPDEDALRYTVELRAVGQEAWRELARDVETTFYSWDTAARPTASTSCASPPTIAKTIPTPARAPTCE